jgi:hypothetical protein
VISECIDALARGAIVIVEETRHRVRAFSKWKCSNRELGHNTHTHYNLFCGNPN